MARKNVETIVPLLPMQQGFLWRSLANDNDACALTLHCTLHGNINLALLEQAWQLIVNAHQALRSSVHWQDLSVPVQVVHKEVTASVNIDYGNPVAPPQPLNIKSEKKATLEHLELTTAPTHRLRIISVSTVECRLEWSISHVLLDGWSCALVIDDWLHQYSALLDGISLLAPSSMALQQYSQWNNKQDDSTVLAYWHKNIPAHVPLATPLPYLELTDPSKGNSSKKQSRETYADKEISLIKHTIDSTATKKLIDSCKASGLSINCILQAAFALALKPLERCSELVLACTVSGRQIELEGIDRYIGMLINVVPVYFTFNQELKLRDWLLEHQANFFTSLPFAHLNLPVFIDERANTLDDLEAPVETHINCLLVVENQAISTTHRDITVSDYRSGIVSEMDMTLVVIPAETLILELRYRNHVLVDSDVNNLFEELWWLLENLPALMHNTLSNIQSAQRPGSTHSPLRVLDRSIKPYEIVNKPKQSWDYQNNTAENIACNPLQPQSLVEQQLSRLWNVVFGHASDPDARFFDLGGTSLQAVRLFALIEKHMGLRLPATALFTSPTIKTLASLILSGQPGMLNQNVVRINSDSKKPPLFIPFEQSDMLMYRHLCEALGSDQPIIGLQTTQTPIDSDHEIDTLIQTMTTVHPEGPYLLAGLSGSGLTAWMIAQKLTRQGRKVSMLTLFDTYGPEYPRLLPPWILLASVVKQFLFEGALFSKLQLVRRLSWKIADHSAEVNRQKRKKTTAGDNQPDSQPVESLFAKRLAEDRRSAVAFARTVCKSQPFAERVAIIAAVQIASINVRSFGLKMELLLLVQGLMLQHCKRNHVDPLEYFQAERISNMEQHDDGISALRIFLKRYELMYGELQPYRGKLVYIAASERQAVCLKDQTFGWGKLMPDDARIYNTPGTHLTMLKPQNVQIMAEILRREMNLAANISTRNPQLCH